MENRTTPFNSKTNSPALVLIAIAVIMAMAFGAEAGQEGNGLDLNRFKWKNRLLFLFGPDRQTEALADLQKEIQQRQAGVADRDLVVFEIVENGQSRMNGTEIAPQTAEALRQRFAAPPNRFSAVLVGKDGGVKMKRNDRVRLDEIFQLIDAMPMRQQEMRE